MDKKNIQYWSSKILKQYNSIQNYLLKRYVFWRHPKLCGGEKNNNGTFLYKQHSLLFVELAIESHKPIKKSWVVGAPWLEQFPWQVACLRCTSPLQIHFEYFIVGGVHYLTLPTFIHSNTMKVNTNARKICLQNIEKIFYMIKKINKKKIQGL